MGREVSERTLNRLPVFGKTTSLRFWEAFVNTVVVSKFSTTTMKKATRVGPLGSWDII